MNENDELIGRKSQDSTSVDDDPHHDQSLVQLTNTGSGRNRSCSSESSSSTNSSGNSSSDKGSSTLPSDKEEDDDFGPNFVSPSTQTTITSLDSTTKRLLSMACKNVQNSSKNSTSGSTSNQCTVSSCGLCDVCRAKSQLDTRSRTITFTRLTYNMDEFDSTFRNAEDVLIRRARRTNWCQMPRKPAPNALLAFFFRYIPFFDWIRSYDVKGGDLNADLLAGLTIAVFQIPQCTYFLHF